MPQTQSVDPPDNALVSAIATSTLVAELARRAAVPPMVAQLLASYTDPAQAVLDVARAAQVAIAWEDRQTIESATRKLTDEEWALVAGDLEDYDEALGMSQARESMRDWIERTLDKHGITWGVEADEDLERCATGCTCPPEQREEVTTGADRA